MNTVDMQYLNFCEQILQKGVRKENRTGTATIGLFGAQMCFDLNQGFPLLTTKRVNFDLVMGELFWFLSGSTKLKDLLRRGVNIWNADAYRFNKPHIPVGMTQTQYIEAVNNDPDFASKHGGLGYGTYGSMWRMYPHHDVLVDQIEKCLHKLKHYPLDRRIIVNSWHPGLVDEIALPPCHVMFQLYAEPLSESEYEFSGKKYKLHLQMYQRSCDMFLGVPFNIASYSLLLKMFAHCVDMLPGNFIHTLGDYHIYENHIDQIKLQLTRTPKDLPKVWIDPDKRNMPLSRYVNLEEIQQEDIVLTGYNPHEAIKGELSVGI